MKCVRLLRTGDIFRVSDTMAAATVSMGEAVYVPKSTWKAAGRKYTKSLNNKENNGERT